MNFKKINELVKKDLVKGLSKIQLTKDEICDAFYKAKQRRKSFKTNTKSFINEPYHLLHLDLFGSLNIMLMSKKRYALVIVNEYTKYTLVYFLYRKDEAHLILLEHVRELKTGSK